MIQMKPLRGHECVNKMLMATHPLAGWIYRMHIVGLPFFCAVRMISEIPYVVDSLYPTINLEK